MRVTLIYKERIEVDAPDDITDKDDAIKWAVDHVEEEGVQVDYYWYDAYVR